MLDFIGVQDIEELYQEIPSELRLQKPLDLPEPLLSEHELREHVGGLLEKNVDCDQYANFLGAGCWQHFVPVLCDEINSRGEFLTAYAGDTYSDHGKHQAWFEFQSLLGELLGMDVVGFPTYDWATAISSAVLMACRLTGRRRVIVPRNLNPEKLSHMRNYCRAALDEIIEVDYDPVTGEMDLGSLSDGISSEVAAVYFENPTYLGPIETRGEEICGVTKDSGAISVVGVDPISLGVLAPPSDYGADIACGEAQTLGIHMQAGTGTCGFIASHEDQDVMAEYPTLLETICQTQQGEWGFGWATLERTSYEKRGLSKDFTGTSTGLWAITAAVYLACMGPQGMKEVGKAILQKSQYAIRRLREIDGLRVPVFDSTSFKEFVVNFDASGASVRDINRALLKRGIFGGKDISDEFLDLGQSALYCVTEVTSLEDIHKLVEGLKEVLG
jgi:glycine dehydrogenase subunit 1